MLTAFLAACLSALDTNLSKAVLSRVRAETYLAWYLTIASTLQLPLLFLYHLSWGVVAWGALLGLLSCAANMLYFRGLARAPVSQAAALRVLAVLVTALLSALLFQERFSLIAYAGMGFILAAIGLSTRLRSNSRLIVGAMLVWGVLYALVKLPLSQGVAPPLLYWVTGAWFLLYLSAFRPGRLPTGQVELAGRSIPFLSLFLALSLIILGEYYALYAALRASGTIGVVLYNLDTVLMVLLGALLFRERLGWTRRVAVILAVVGVILVQAA